MGNFEKLVVLTVLFLSAIVLAISLNDEDAGDENLSPLGAAKAQLGETRPDTAADDQTTRSFLLSTEVEAAGPHDAAPLQPVVVQRADDAAGKRSDTTSMRVATPPTDASGKLRILRNEEGLTGAGIEDYRVYALRDGDTWSGLSERFYGGGRYVHLLRSANEEVSELHAGERILVPVYDFAQEAGQRDPYVPRSEQELAAPSAKPVAPATALPDDVATARTYTVRPGDSLTKISQVVYGTAARWEAIFAANSGKLESPDWLQVGMDLVIPRGSELDTLTEQAKAAAAATAAEPADATERPRVR